MAQPPMRPRRRRRDLGRLFARALCAVFALVGAVPFAIGVLVRTPPVLAWAARQTAAVLERELGVTATYGVRMTAWPLAIALSDVVVEGSDGAGPALRVSRIAVRPRLFSLLSGRLDAGQIELDGPRARLVVTDGRLRNVRYRLPESSADPGRRAPFTSVAVTDAAIDLTWETVRVRARDLDVDIAAEQGPTFDIAIRAGEQIVDRQRTSLVIDGPGGPAFDEDTVCQLDGRLRIGPSGIVIRRMSLEAVADLDEAQGTRPPCQLGPDDPHRVEIALRQFQLRPHPGQRPEISGAAHLRAPIGLTNRFVAFPPLRGFLTLDVEGSWGQGGVMPSVHGTIQGRGLELERYKLAAQLDSDIAIEDDVIRAQRTTVAFADGIVTGNKMAIEPLKKGAPMRVASVDTSNVRFTALMRDLGVTPRAHVTWLYRSGKVVSFEGTLAPLKLDGEFTMATSDFEVFDRPFDDPARRHMIGVREAKLGGHLNVRQDSVTFRGAHADFGSSHLDTTVMLGFHNDIVLSVAPGSRVDLSDISPIANLKMAGKATVSTEMKGKFGDPLLLGDLSVQGLFLHDFPVGDVTSSKVRFSPLTVDFYDVKAKKGKTVFESPSTRLDFNGPASLLVDARVTSSDFYLRDFFHMWHFDTDPRFDPIDGHGTATASVHYDLGGPADKCGDGALAVDGKLQLSSADLFEEHYDSADTDFRYFWGDPQASANGLDIDVRSITLRKGRGTLFGSATIRRGGVVRGEMVATDVPISRIQAFGALGRALDGTLSATATIGGTIDALETEVDARVSAVRAAGAVLPPSRVKVVLTPLPRSVSTTGKTHCGQPIGSPFDRSEWERDTPDGVFHASGTLFGGGLSFDDLRVTRQRHKVASGTVTIAGLTLDGLGRIASSSGGRAGPSYGGQISGLLSIDAFSMDAPERASATLRVDALALSLPLAHASLAGPSATITVRGDRLAVAPFGLTFTSTTGLKGSLSVRGEVRHLSGSRELDLVATVPPLELASLAGLVPRVERASGQVSASIHLSGKLAEPTYAGEAHVKKGELAVRGLGLPISNIDLDLAIDGGEIRIARGRANVGGGTISLSGHVPVRGFRLGEGAVLLVAKGIALPTVDGVSMTCDADLRVQLPERDSEDDESNLPKITGEIVLTSFTYARPIGISADIGSLAQRGRRKVFDAYDPADDVVALDLRVRSLEPLRLRNNLVDAQLVVDSDALVFSGTNQRFGLGGRLRLLPGGRIRLRANDFEIRQGFVRFDDTTRIAPSVDVTAVTDYRRYASSASSAPGGAGASSGASTAAPSSGGSGPGRTGGSYRITLHAYGDADNLRLDMTSEPALSQEDIVLLLTIGMTRAELDQLQASNLGGSAALEALTSLTGADTAVRKAVPVIDDFHFGTAYSSRTGSTEPTVTLSKRLTNEVRANVTSGLSENREIRSNVEVKITPRVSVQGSYDNVNDVSSSSLGNLGADVRYRLEFE